MIESQSELNLNIFSVEAIENNQPTLPAPLENIKLAKAPKEQKTPSLATIDEFLAQTKSVYVKAGELVEIPIEYVPLLNCHKQCYIIISNEQIGDFVSQINARGTLDTRTANSLDDEEVLFWKCHIGEKNKIRIKMDLRNQKLVHAVQKLAKYHMFQGTIYVHRKVVMLFNRT